MAAAPAICVQHPHNHYLQARPRPASPAWCCSAPLVLAWLRRARPRPAGATRTRCGSGLFVAALIQQWPIASTSDFVSMPLGGWFFLLLGLGLAEARPAAFLTSHRRPI